MLQSYAVVRASWGVQVLRRTLITASKGSLVSVSKHSLAPEGAPNPDKFPHYGVISMASAPVNSVSPELLADLKNALSGLEADKSVRGVILTSSLKGYFSAGIDLGVFTKGEDVWKNFWKGVRDFYLQLYESHLVSVAAINGHAPGAGTIFALGCHYRYMVRNKTLLGLNEVSLGLPVPGWITDRSVQVIGHRHSERLLPLGTTIPAEAAEKIDLIDQSFDDEEAMINAAVEQLRETSSKLQFAQQATYKLLRQPHASAMRKGEAEDIQQSWGVVSSDKFQAALKALQDRLAAKKKK